MDWALVPERQAVALVKTVSKRNHRKFLGKRFMLVRQCFETTNCKQWF